MKVRVFTTVWMLLLAVLFVLPAYGKGNKELNEALIQASSEGNSGRSRRYKTFNFITGND